MWWTHFVVTTVVVNRATLAANHHCGVATPCLYDHQPCHICSATPNGPTYPHRGHPPTVEYPPRDSLLAVQKTLGQCLQVHIDRHSPQERRQLEIAPHFGSWANSMIAVLEAVCKLLKLHQDNCHLTVLPTTTSTTPIS